MFARILSTSLAILFSYPLCQSVFAYEQAASTDKAKKEIITVYSSRKEHLIKPLFDEFTDRTGIEVQYITDEAGPLMERLKAEGQTTRADMFMTVDAGVLWKASQEGLLQSIESSQLEKAIPSYLRSPRNDWFGLSVRARTIVYSTERVQPQQLSTYESLADNQWKGRLCLRTAKKIYNQSLVATMIDSLGAERTEAVVKGWVDNLAVPPYASDTQAIEAILANQCDVTLVNTYYFGRLLNENPSAKLAIFWPNQVGEGVAGRGVHVNISGAGVTHHAKNPAAAQKLLEWLASEEAQGNFASLNQEYPVNPVVKPSAIVASWGDFKKDQVNVETAGRLQADAVKLMDRAGYK
jgi:iron(III) transport system substrate-binding protein